MKIKTIFWGYLSNGKFCHFPLLYIGYGSNSFAIAILLIQIVVLWGVKNQEDEKGVQFDK